MEKLFLSFLIALFLISCSSLTPISTPTATFEPTPTTTPKPLSLKDFANKKNILLGVAASGHVLANVNYENLVETEFNASTICFSWAQIEPNRGDYYFYGVDDEVGFATRNNMKITGLHLLWNADLPTWLVNGNFTEDELKEILHEYIITLASRYKGKIHIWSVANEYTWGQLWGGDFWNDQLGPEYLEMAFKWAHETDPDALLMLNQDGNESMEEPYNASIVNKMISVVQQMKEKEIPIDVIGMQMHLLSPYSNKHIPSKQDVIQTMQKFSELGFPVYITEFDVNLHDLSGSQEEKFNYQAQVYKEMLQACLESRVCKGFSIFGIDDGNSWYDEVFYASESGNAQSLIFDENLNPKPAYYALLQALSE